MQGSLKSQLWQVTLWRRWVLLLVAGGIVSGCSEGSVSTVPLDGTAVGTRTATPERQTFANGQRGPDPPFQHLWASFVILPEQLQAARTAPVSLQPQAILPCTDCNRLHWQPGAPPPTPSSRALGIYRPEQLSFSFQVQPDKTSTHLKGIFKLDTTTPLIHPGQGVRLTVQRAVLGEGALEPLPSPQDFHPQQINRGQLQERTWTLPFVLAAAPAPTPMPPLQLDVLLTSPIPPDSAPFQRGKPLPPPTGQIYHASSWAGAPTWEQLWAYRQAIGQPPAWVEVEYPWDRQRDFPQLLASRIRESGSVPYLRLRLQPDHLAAFAAGEEDKTIRSWAQGIQRFATPIFLAVAPRQEDGQTQQQAYQYLMRTLRSDANLLWVLELEEEEATLSTWAKFRGMDWLKVQLAGDPTRFAQTYRRLTALYPGIPLLLGGIAPAGETSAAWLEGLENQQWPQVIGWSWSLGSEGIPASAAQRWRQHLQSQQRSIWRGEIRVQPPPSSPSPTPSPSS